MRKTGIALCMTMVLLAGCSAQTGQQGTPAAEQTAQTTAEAASETAETEAEAGGVTDGTYTGTARGNNGDITVEVTITEGKLEAVKVVNQAETRGISDFALKVLPERMVESQSVAVDAISGCTMTSNGIINAVSDCLKQAGANLDDWKGEPVSYAAAYSDETCDVVVVGSGAAGMTAAINAADAGAKVILVEKLDILGGTSLLSNSMFGSVGTSVHQAEGKTETVEDLYENYMKQEAATKAYAESDAARVLAENSAPAAEYLIGLGVPLDHTSSAFILAPQGGSGLGSYVIPALTKEMDRAGVDYRVANKATKLLVENGEAKGIVVETENGGYTISADAVILATGGFAAGRDMVEKYLPEWSGSIYYCSPGNTGDGINMAIDAGLEVTDLTIMKANPLVFYDGTRALTMNAAVGAGAIMVNKEGERFVNEQGSYGISPDINKQTDGEGIVIFDNTIPETVEAIQGYVEKGYLTEAASIEELSEKLDIDSENLAKTVARYQEMAAAGEDTDFGKKVVADCFSGTTIYGIVVKPSIQGTFGGVRTNTEAEVYGTDGQIIKGMYAAGECAQEGINGLNPMTANLVFGKIAGSNAAEFALAD